MLLDQLSSTSSTTTTVLTTSHAVEVFTCCSSLNIVLLLYEYRNSIDYVESRAIELYTSTSEESAETETARDIIQQQ